MLSKKIIFAILMSYLVPIASTFAQIYSYSVNLNHLVEDKLQIELTIPSLEKDNMVFCIPKIVPGIYGAMDFGELVTSIQALDNQGIALPIKKLSKNTWKISKAKKLAKLVYWVRDGFDEFDIKHRWGKYKSASSLFKQDEVFVMNHNCLFGYFEKLDTLPYHITFAKPEHLYAATNLENISTNAQQAVFKAPNYRTLVDNPILFAKPDTASVYLDNVQVKVAVYSTTKIALAQEIIQNIEPLLKKQKAYLGDTLPIQSYTFLIYHNDCGEQHRMGDGLEHAQSTLIFLCIPPDKQAITQMIYGIASHEFFHTLMPLAIHSEEIANYDFINPTMSKHLWLYEGMTEYFTIHNLIKGDVNAANLSNFINTLQQKIEHSSRFDNNLSLTALSTNAMAKQDEYYNIYLKGALVCLCLDIRLRELSSGKYGVQDLIQDLWAKYGINKPFKDDELFADIQAFSNYPNEIAAFITTYIEGANPPPLQAYFNKVGLDYNPTTRIVQLAEQPTEAQLQLRKYWLE